MLTAGTRGKPLASSNAFKELNYVFFTLWGRKLVEISSFLPHSVKKIHNLCITYVGKIEKGGA